MKRIFLTFVMVFICSSVGADIITIDSSNWTQSQKNGVEVACLRVLYDAGITHDGVNVNLPNVEIVNPSASIGFITKAVLKAEYDEWMAELDAAAAIEQAEIDAKNAEITSSEMKQITKQQAIDKIDSISNLTQAKTFLKKLVRYMWAKGYFEDQSN